MPASTWTFKGMISRSRSSLTRCRSASELLQRTRTFTCPFRSRPLGIAEGFNHVTSVNDPAAHAEVVAIRTVRKALGTHSLEGCEIYASCKP